MTMVLAIKGGNAFVVQTDDEHLDEIRDLLEKAGYDDGSLVYRLTTEELRKQAR